MSCRCSNPDYLIMTRELLANFEKNAAQRERDDVLKLLNNLAINWSRPVGHNPRKMIFAIADAIKAGEHLG